MEDALISTLRQLRDGYPRRPENFPHSLALVGLRDVRDYKVASGGSTRLQTASPFNIKVKSLTLRNFNQSEILQLYQQHTAETGQQFSADAIQVAYELTQGQPWLVNALAKEVVIAYNVPTVSGFLSTKNQPDPHTPTASLLAVRTANILP